MKKSFIILSAICLLLSKSTLTSAELIVNTTLYNEVNSTNFIKSTTSPDTENTNISSEPLWPEDKPNVYSEAAIVMEASTGAILYSKNIHQTYYPASITKILTALLAIENSSLRETVTFSREAIFDVELDSSRIGIDVGEKLTMEQSIYSIMLASANEVSYAIAEHIGGDLGSFSELMNAKAKELGALNSHFVNPHGLPDPNHYTTAYDMALISRAAIRNPVFREITRTRTYAIPPTNIQEETRYFANHHKFIKGDKKYEGSIGGKTGYTSIAKYTLVTFAERNGMTLVSVIMKCDSIEHEYSDTAKLLDYGFNNFTLNNITDMVDPNAKESTLFTKYSPLFNRSTSHIQLSEDGNIVLPNTATFQDAIKEINLEPITEIKVGKNIIGNVTYTYDGVIVGYADIVFNNIPPTSMLKSSYTPTPLSTEQTDGLKDNEEEKDSTIKPVIIGIIVGVLVLIIGLYIVFIELPFHRRRKNYQQKRARRRGSDQNYFMDI
jgi:D-alanyl-D-alanine carboxypeptidase